MNKKYLLIFLTVLSVAVALTMAYGVFRLYIIRLTLHTNLPGWLKAFLWGWLY